MNAKCRIYLVCLSIALLLAYKPLLSRLWHNAGMTLLTQVVSVGDTTHKLQLDQVYQLLQQAATLDSGNTRVYWGMGLVGWYKGEITQVAKTWQHMGVIPEDVLVFGEHTSQIDVALQWYRVAELLGPDNPAVWRAIGPICQTEREYDKNGICGRFLAYNHRNWLVDPQFLVNHSNPWQYNLNENVTYTLGSSCPTSPEHRCATLAVAQVIPENGAGFWQAVDVEPGISYRFEAWIKITLDRGYWRPVYYGGAIQGIPQGRWPGNQTETIDWEHWENCFTAETFDNHRAVFYPILLYGKGQAWFYDAKLIQVTACGTSSQE